MNITRVTLQWYREKVEPKWARKVLEKTKYRVSIDAVINFQSGTEHLVDCDHVNHNLLTLCQHYRKRGVLLEELERLATVIGGTRDKRRTATALKWAKRIEKSRQEAGV